MYSARLILGRGGRSGVRPSACEADVFWTIHLPGLKFVEFSDLSRFPEDDDEPDNAQMIATFGGSAPLPKLVYASLLATCCLGVFCLSVLHDAGRMSISSQLLADAWSRGAHLLGAVITSIPSCSQNHTMCAYLLTIAGFLPDRSCALEGFWDMGASNHGVVVRLSRRTSGWTATYYPPANTWYDGSSGPMRADVLLSDDQADIRQATFMCSEGRTDVVAPFASPSAVTWGTETLTMWGGTKNNAALSWVYPVDTAAWENSQLLCPISTATHLYGQAQLTVRSGGCQEQSFKRLSPETAPLNQAGFDEVSKSGFAYGMEIFIRRFAHQHGLAVIEHDHDLASFLQEPRTKNLAELTAELKAAGLLALTE